MTTPTFNPTRAPAHLLRASRYIAQDPNGDWYGFRNRPRVNMAFGDGIWSPGRDQAGTILRPYFHFLYHGEPSKDWHRTLREVQYVEG